MTDRTSSFHHLHRSGCFVMPNPWDEGTARLFESLGFRAVATTSSGAAWSRGRADNGMPLSEVLAHFRTMAAAVAVPVNADFEGGFAVEPTDVATNVRAACGTGVAGLSIEDSTGDGTRPLYAFDLAVERVRAAKRAITKSGAGTVFTARSEGFIVGRPDLAETIRRLTAFAEAGADCVYAPGLKNLDDIRDVVRAVAPTPVNVLVSSGFTTVAALADLGVRRISVGGALARVAWKSVIDATRAIAEQGDFSALSGAVSGDDLNRLFQGS